MTTITTRMVQYPADGLTMIGHLALPAGVDRRPAVLLGPEGTGLSDVERRRADALAELGYIALAFDLHGGRYLGDPEEMLARCMPLLADPDRMRGIGHAALDVLRTEPRTDPDRIAAIGYGTGGAVRPRAATGASWSTAAPCTPSTTRRSTTPCAPASATTHGTHSEPGATSSTCSPSACP
jgi:dienelactone hydrolase